MRYEIVWTADSEAHIARHNVTPTEVEEVVHSRPVFKRTGRNGTLRIYGRTEAGRPLAVVLAKAPDGRTLVVTARRMDPTELRAFQKRETLKKRKTIEELRDYYDTHDLSGDIKKAKLVTEPPEELLISTSIRLPKPLMDAVRARAAEAGVPYTTLIRQWVLDRLDDEQPVIAVSDLQQFILSHSRSA